jgi:hypothetical protein
MSEARFKVIETFIYVPNQVPEIMIKLSQLIILEIYILCLSNKFLRNT